ncbi:MAG: PEGA domain-containing protein [Deltaproteobacteria bacterium]|nr:PEGA domain-containing protein [Deltaproteobacteria bacterium]
MNVACRRIALLVVVLAAARAQAEEADAALGRALAAFGAGEWDKAATLLRIVAPQIKDAAARARAYKTLGLAEIERKRPSDAESAFVKALTADPVVDIDPNEDPPKAVTLFRAVRDRLDGRLVVTATPSGARVSVDGVDQGPAPFEGRAKIGKRRVRVATPDGAFVRELADVVVRVDRVTTLSLKLEARTAFLVVGGGAGAAVFVDGAKLGDTPLARAALMPGRRVVEIRRDGFKPQRFEWTFSPDAEKVVVPELEPLTIEKAVTRATPVTTTRATARRTRTWGIVALGIGIAAVVVGASLYGIPSLPAHSGSRESYENELGSFNTKVDTGLGVLVTGGVLMVSSGVLFALHREAPSGPLR